MIKNLKLYFILILVLGLSSNIFSKTIESNDYPGLRLTNGDAQIRFNGGNTEKWCIGSTGSIANHFIIHDVVQNKAILVIDDNTADVQIRTNLKVTQKVAIGTTKHKSDDTGNFYKLTVNGGIYALDLRIRPSLSADFVFENDYNLMPLSELKTSIQKNKHLPGIPSEKEVQKDGVSVAEMQTKLLQKIEELTLYVIDLKEENEIQSKELKLLKRQINNPIASAN